MNRLTFSCYYRLQAIEEGGLEEYEEQRRRKAGKRKGDDAYDSAPGTPTPSVDKKKRSRGGAPAATLEKGAPNPPELTKQFKKMLHTVLQHEDT